MDLRKCPRKLNEDRVLQAYIIGIALGDGNLSNPNGRATRLRVTCDTAYPRLITRIRTSIQQLLPENKVSINKHKGRCIYISCYSNHFEKLLGWKAAEGSKISQGVSIPYWIMQCRETMIACLRGLIETDGSIYKDRGYTMINFTSSIESLAEQVRTIIQQLHFQAHMYVAQNKKRPKYTVRISKHAEKFIRIVNVYKN